MQVAFLHYDPDATLHLHLAALPVLFKTPLSNLEGEAGGNAIFRCELTKLGSPVVWKRGKNILESSRKHQLKQDGAAVELIICGLEGADSGEYSCDSGHDVTTASLAVKGRSTFNIPHSLSECLVNFLQH